MVRVDVVVTKAAIATARRRQAVVVVPLTEGAAEAGATETPGDGTKHDKISVTTTNRYRTCGIVVIKIKDIATLKIQNNRKLC